MTGYETVSFDHLDTPRSTQATNSAPGHQPQPPSVTPRDQSYVPLPPHERIAAGVPRVLKMSTPEFAIFVDIDGAGSHPAAGRDNLAPQTDRLSARGVANAVRAAERAGFTAVTFDDHPLPNGTPRLDAVIRASFSAPLTSSIGLIPVVHALYNEPFHVATQIASVDTASHGRAGWIIGADPDPAIARRHGREPLPLDAVDDEIVDVVEAVRRLWDSWEDDAVIRDRATGRYLDRDRLHYADFVGERFSVKGPSILPRSPQGQSLVVGSAGTRAEVDVVLLDSPLAEVEGTAAAERQRHGETVRLVLDLEVALDRAGQTGRERLEALDALPARKTPDAHDAVSTWHASTRARYVGDASGLVDLLLSLSGDVDGVRILPAVLDDDLDEIGRAVLPRLRTLGTFTSPRAGATLRRSLGLGHPANRFEGVSR